MSLAGGVPCVSVWLWAYNGPRARGCGVWVRTAVPTAVACVVHAKRANVTYLRATRPPVSHCLHIPIPSSVVRRPRSVVRRRDCRLSHAPKRKGKYAHAVQSFRNLLNWS